ncbi:MAG: tRNA (adenosine(37)-N6)-threonylcarbamoyltransferase complex dimerization subunit type 1 TsaB [Gemmatimonadales bacterium]
MHPGCRPDAMLILALDTSTEIGSVAIGDRNGIIATSTLPVRGAHSESMLPAMRDLLTRADVSIGDLEGVAVGSGPGSFTGLRVGASLAKGLCFGRGLPLFAYSSLSAVVAGRSVEGRACAMFDARGGRVFAATYESTIPLVDRTAPQVWTVPELILDLQPLDDWTFGGDGAMRYEDLIVTAGGRLLPEDESRPHAEALLHLTRERPDGRVKDVRSWQPEYLLPSAAERLSDRRALR